MRLISLPLLLLCSTMCAQESPATADNAKRRLVVTNSWFANSHADASFMPQGIEAMVVTPDGTTYTNIGWEEGGGNVAVVTADGTVQPRPHQPGYFGW